jgi:hypothetical protein
MCNFAHWLLPFHITRESIMNFFKSLSPVAKAGFKFGTFVAAAVAPVVIVMAAGTWISKKS